MNNSDRGSKDDSSHDKEQIFINEEWEVKFRTAQLKVSREQLIVVITIVNNYKHKIIAHLKK